MHGTNSKLVTFVTGSVIQQIFHAVTTGAIYHVAFGSKQLQICLLQIIKIGLNGVWDTVIAGSVTGYSGARLISAVNPVLVGVS